MSNFKIIGIICTLVCLILIGYMVYTFAFSSSSKEAIHREKESELKKGVKVFTDPEGLVSDK